MSDSATTWTVTHKSPLSVGFCRQDYWRGLPYPPPEDLPDPGIELTFLMSPALTDGFFNTSTTWEAPLWTTGVGCHALLQGIFPTQESNPGLLHGRQILFQLSYQGSP